MTKSKEGLGKQLRKLFGTNKLYSLRALSDETGYSLSYITHQISILQNETRCGPDGPLELKRVKVNGKIFWGKTTAERYVG
jgi:hypothetical protein